LELGLASFDKFRTRALSPRIARAADADRGSLKEEKKSYALLSKKITLL
jgi:hypothetical protein